MMYNLKQVRELSGKKQSEVAEDLGISLSTYRSWEQGKRNLNGKKLSMLANYFDVSTDTIVGTKYAQPIDQQQKHEPAPQLPIVGIFEQLNDNGKAELMEYAAYLLSQDRFQKKEMPNYPNRLQETA